MEKHKYFLKTNASEKEKNNNDNTKYICNIVNFDAWQYNDQEHIWAALVMAFIDKCKNKPDFFIRYFLKELWNYLKNNYIKLIFKCVLICAFYFLIAEINKYLNIPLIESVLGFSLRLKIILLFILAPVPDFVKLDLGGISIEKNFKKCFKTPDYKEQLGYKNEIIEIIKYILNYLGKGGKERIVLFIDNLDRCSAANIKQIIDSISQFLEICNGQKDCNKKITVWNTISQIFKMFSRQETRNKKITVRNTISLFWKIYNKQRARNKKNSVRDTISKFWKICNRLIACNEKNAGLITIFAMDEEIIFNALKKENIPETKINEYLKKIINLPICIQMPENIDNLIDRFFGSEQNDTKVFLKEKYKRHKYNPRNLSNLRYIDHMMYRIDSEYNWTSGKINLDEERYWYPAKKQLPDGHPVEYKVIKYLENIYNCNIRTNIMTSTGFIFDAIATLPNKDILFEIKSLSNEFDAMGFCQNTIEQITKHADSFNTDKNVELIIVFVVSDTINKEKLTFKLNQIMQQKLSNTKFSGQILLLTNNDLSS